jgi:succinoglycan biosynthesis transport protein ExoP
LELMQYWKVIQKNLWLIILIAVLGTGAVTYLSLKEPPQYQSNATLLLNPSAQTDLAPQTKTKMAADLAVSYSELMRTRSFADAVIKDLPFALAARKLNTAISTKLTANTLFYQITGVMDTPVKAQQLVSTTIKVFLATNQADLEDQANKNKNTAKLRDDMGKSLDARLQDVRNQITQSQAEITALESQPPSKDRNDYLLILRTHLLGLQQTEVSTITAIAQVAQLPGDAGAPTTALVIDEPQPGNALPSSLTQNVSLALIVSLLLGVGLAFLRDYMDYTIRSPEYLEKVIGLSPVTAIGKLRSPAATWSQGKHPLSGHGLVTLEQPQSPASESFRMLRTNIQLLSPDKPIRSIVVTSVGPKEGKSFTAANLATVIAQAGNRTILVDADLRKSNVHELFGVPNNAGFSSLLQNKSPNIAGAIQLVPGVENLAVITSGPLPDNPSELLNSQQASQIMSQLVQQVDMVIYDAPPAGVAIDSVILATRVDAVIMVVNAGSTRRDMVVRVKHTLQNIGVTTLLPVLNRVKPRDLSGYYYTQYYTYGPKSSGNSNGHSNSNGNGNGNGHGAHSSSKVLTDAGSEPTTKQQGR